jgi:Ras-related protein Rab-1A
MGEDYDYLFKILLIGDSGVGKSCLLLKYTDDIFSDSYLSTIGVDFKIKTETVDGKSIKLQIWDTAGQERFRTITSSYYRGAHAIAVVFDLTSRESFENLEKWLAEIEKHVTGPHTTILIGTKADAVAKQSSINKINIVNKEEVTEFTKRHSLKYVETSAKTGEGVNQVFSELCRSLMESNVTSGIKNSTNGNTVSPGKPIEISKNGCC